MAYSAGFTPHPKISYAGAAAMGAASEAEYLEISVTERLDPDQLCKSLNAALPPGIDVVDVVEAGAGALAERLEVSDWVIELPGMPEAEAEAAVQAFLAHSARGRPTHDQVGPAHLRRAGTGAATRRIRRSEGWSPGLCDTSHGGTAHHTCCTTR